MCFYADFYSCILLHLLALSAIIVYLISILDNCLVSSSSKCKIHCCLSYLIIPCIIISTCTYTDTECKRFFIANLYTFYIFNKTELIRKYPFKELISEHNQIFVLLHLSYNSSSGRKILVHSFIY